MPHRRKLLFTPHTQNLTLDIYLYFTSCADHFRRFFVKFTVSWHSHRTSPHAVVAGRTSAKRPGVMIRTLCRHRQETPASPMLFVGNGYHPFRNARRAFLPVLTFRRALPPESINPAQAGLQPLHSSLLLLTSQKSTSSDWMRCFFVLALPIFPCSHPQSIVGEGVLNFCVRDGNRWTHTPINTNFVGTVFTVPQGYTLKTEH